MASQHVRVAPRVASSMLLSLDVVASDNRYEFFMGFRDQSAWPSVQHFAPDLPRLLSFELNDGEAAEVIEHLRTCDPCRRELVEAVAGSYPPEATLPRWFNAPAPRPTRRVTVRRGGLRRPYKGLLVLVGVCLFLAARYVLDLPY